MEDEQHVTEPPDSQQNYLVVDSKTEDSTIEGAFQQFTKERKDIAIVLINQHVSRPNEWRDAERCEGEGMISENTELGRYLEG